MGAKPRPPRYPYPFIGHGVGYARKHLECFVAFEQPVTGELRGWIEARLPAPLSILIDWCPRGLVFGSDDGIWERVIAAYPGEPIEDIPGAEQWQALAADVDRFLFEIAARVSIAAVVWPLDAEIGHRTDEWHDWSLQFVPELIDKHLAGQGPLVGRFADCAQSALDASREPRPEPPASPRLADLESAWNRARLVDMQRELAFALQWPESAEGDLRTLFHTAAEAGDWQLALRVSEDVLGQTQPAYCRDQWLVHRVEALIELGDLEGARRALPAALIDASLYDNSALLAMLRLCEADERAAVYHAGIELGSYFRLEAALSAPPARPPKVMQRFAEIFRRWVAPAWKPGELSWGELTSALINFETIHRRTLAAEIAEARAAIDRFKEAIAGRDMSRLLELPLDQTMSDQLGDLAIELAPRSPDLAAALFRRACSFWRVSYKTLAAALEREAVPADLIDRLPAMVRFGGYPRSLIE